MKAIFEGIARIEAGRIRDPEPFDRPPPLTERYIHAGYAYARLRHIAAVLLDCLGNQRVDVGKEQHQGGNDQHDYDENGYENLFHSTPPLFEPNYGRILQKYHCKN